MTEKELRNKVVRIMQGWVGLKRSDRSHKVIIDTYNSHKPLARGYKVKYTDAYCATTVSAAAIKSGLTDIIPTECGCGQLIELFKKLGSWQENDAYVPEAGDVIFYDWDDNGVGDCKGWPEHVGAVEKVSGSTITVIEGNLNGNVDRRAIKVNARYIRGYGVPDYASKADHAEVDKPSGGSASSIRVGDTVEFTGKTHYVSSYPGAKGVSCKPGTAKVTAISAGRPHPYHLVHTGKGCTVYGWVDEKSIRK